MMKEQRELSLKKVEPTILFWGVPTCSEEKAAAIRNKTVECMKENDIRAVAYRYLQNNSNKSREKNVAIGTFAFNIFVVILTFGFIHYINSSINREEETNAKALQPFDLMCQILLTIFNTYNYILLHSTMADLGNMLRYKETEEACLAWLSEHLNPQDIKKIQNMTYTKNSFFAVNKLLENNSEAKPINIPNKFKDNDSQCLLM